MADVCFDLDGTLTDPFEGITRCIQFALEREGLEVLAQKDLARCIGPPLLGSMTELAGGDGESGTRMLGFYRERFGDVGLLENSVYAGIPEVLSCLREEGRRLWVVTSKPGVYATQILEHFGLAEWFEGVYGSELDGRFADKRELLGYMVGREGLDVGEAVMVGDRRHDFEAARSVGMRSVGVAWGYGSEEELGMADTVVREVGALAGAVLG